MTATAEPPQTQANEEWYRAGPSISSFHQSDAFVRILLGGRGSGKTAAVGVEAARHIWQNAGAKVIIARKTETSQVGSTIDTLTWCFSQMGSYYDQAASHNLFRSWNNGLSFRLPSQLALQKLQEASLTIAKEDLATWVEQEGHKYCGRIEMKGLPHVSAGDSKLRGMECSMMVFVEGDQIEERAFNLAFACLRWKGTDPTKCDDKGFIRDRSIILDSNPPGEQHWIAKMEGREKTKPKSQRRMAFWHIHTKENEHNLPENYIRDTILTPYEFNPPMIRRMLEGQYADAYEGKPVYFAYSRERHERKIIGWPMGANMVIGMDMGVNNTSVISAYIAKNGRFNWWVMREVVLTGSDAERQSRELLNALSEEFPFWNTGTPSCPQCLFFCDPAARNRAGTSQGPTSSALKVLHSHQIFPGYKLNAHLQPTITAVNRLLQQHYQTDAGKTIWSFQIDPERAPELCSGLRGKYRYPTMGEPGWGSNKPIKGDECDGVDHVCDALRYAIINVLDIAQETHPSDMTTRQPATPSIEPPRTI